MANSRSVIIIGAGIAGLSAGIYAQRNGYQSQIYEMHTMPGGLMTAWTREGYTVDACIQWLTGSSPKSDFYPFWEEIGLTEGRQMYDPEVFMRYEGRDGQVFEFYADIDRLEKHMLEIGPEDREFIHEFCSAARSMVGFNWSVAMEGSNSPVGRWGGFFRTMVQMLPMLPKLLTLRKWGGMSLADVSQKFANPFLREVFAHLWLPEISAAGLLLTLALLYEQPAGYPIGGSLPMALAVEKRYCDLGGAIHYGCKVEKILVENHRAVGIQLADGSERRANYVISAADGHATIFDMLGGHYIDDEIRTIYSHYLTFPPIVLIGLGVKRSFDDLPGLTGGLSIHLSRPIEVAGQCVDSLDIVIYNFDPTLAPEGSTVLRVTVPTNYTYWKELDGDRERYEAEKERIGMEIINRLDQRFPGFAGQIEMVDVATPATFERFTGNWQASYEGFLPTPKTVVASIAKTLPGLENFYMAGQWVQAGGGLPSGVITGRQVVMQMCKKDGIPFGVQPELEERKMQEHANHDAQRIQAMSHPDR